MKHFSMRLLAVKRAPTRWPYACLRSGLTLVFSGIMRAGNIRPQHPPNDGENQPNEYENER
ncbi:MAG: hypothetical protein H0X40_03000 [Chthoniobacterales bacterium]|nr:hypothetical protein [Chthoniobacterales bacterium]